MAVLNYFATVSASATPYSQDPSTTSASPPNPRQTRVVLPKKKPQKWSTGVAPGDYGGPPTTKKLRKYWGGEGEDPITSDEFIWNKDFMGRMQRLIDPDSSSVPPAAPLEETSGFLNLNRAMSLDSLEVDLSKELAIPAKPVVGHTVDGGRQDVLASQGVGTVSRKWRLAPTRREQEKWDRATKAATGGSDVMLRESRRTPGDPKVLAAQAREQYFKLKKKLQIWTLGIGGIGVVSAYVSYSPEVAASFGAGLFGSLVYIRMLGNSVDSLADGAKGLVKGAAAQPRLLVPVALVMIYNRWNDILVPNYGFMHLDLIPMLVGFFTYKIATFVQAIEEALTVVEKETQA
ncbi:hypothetical protein Syun_008827 [Stephania yunnanensis]|uniref:CGL160/ATPI domain-containing protein n=1 Tax=Stephania yunnanensis TaxID=152371 RepID=A0AAP0PMX8_9MAGN